MAWSTQALRTPDRRALTSDRVRRFYERAARHYDGWMQRFDPVFLGDGRHVVCGRAGGTTLEIAVGTGLNLPYYSPDVHLTAIDSSAAMLQIAAHRAAALRQRVAFGLGDAERLAFSDGSFDCVVCTLALLRDPMDHRPRIGFVVETCARSRLGMVQRVVARKP